MRVRLDRFRSALPLEPGLNSFRNEFTSRRPLEHTVDNVGLRCRPHNVYEAHRDYGRAFMDAKRRKPAGVRERHAPYVKAAHRLVLQRADESIAMKALLRAPPPSLPNASGPAAG